ncbi:MAG: Gfo/Idh/MocA family protein [Actinomycetes bacterium]
MRRIGLVGCGHIGTVHSLALGQLTRAGLIDAAITGTHDADRSRAAEQARHHDATVFDDLEELADASDVLWVCTWTSAHREAVRAAAARGLPVFCEKPLAPTLAECEEIAVDLRRVPHQVGLVLRHAPVFRAVAEAVASGRYGRPMATILRDDQYFPIQGMYGSTWRSDVARAGGGTLIEHSIHDVDLLHWILGGMPGAVAGRVSSTFGYPGIEDTATVTLDYGDHRATIVSVWHQVMTRPSTRRLEVFCEEALLWTEDDFCGPLLVETSDGAAAITGTPPAWIERFSLPEDLARRLAPYAEPGKAFLDGLDSDVPEEAGFPDVEVALAAHRVVDLAYRSSAAGGPALALGG